MTDPTDSQPIEPMTNVEAAIFGAEFSDWVRHYIKQNAKEPWQLAIVRASEAVAGYREGREALLAIGAEDATPMVKAAQEILGAEPAEDEAFAQVDWEFFFSIMVSESSDAGRRCISHP